MVKCAVAPATPSAMPTTTIRGACPHDCPDTCALLTTVGTGALSACRATRRMRPPAACSAPGVALCRAHAPCRAHPHPAQAQRVLRAAAVHARVLGRGAGRHRRRLTEIATRDPQAIPFHSYAGTMGLVQGERAWTALLPPLSIPCCTAASAPLPVARAWCTRWAALGMKVEFFAESKLILIWGSALIGSNLHFWRIAQQAKRDGARLVHRPAPHRDRREMPRTPAAAPRHRRRAGPGADARTHSARLAGPRLHRAPRWAGGLARTRPRMAARARRRGLRPPVEDPAPGARLRPPPGPQPSA